MLCLEICVYCLKFFVYKDFIQLFYKQQVVLGYPGYKDREEHSNGRFIQCWLKMEIITIPIIRKLQNETVNIQQNKFGKKKALDCKTDKYSGQLQMEFKVTFLRKTLSFLLNNFIIISSLSLNCMSVFINVCKYLIFT